MLEPDDEGRIQAPVTRRMLDRCARLEPLGQLLVRGTSKEDPHRKVLRADINSAVVDAGLHSHAAGVLTGQMFLDTFNDL
jgi:hypothetical protein